MAREEGRELPGRMTQRMDAWVGTHAVTPAQVALRQGNLTHWEGPKTGAMLLRSTHKMRKSQADTWTKTPGRYIRFYDKQNKVNLTHSKTFEQKWAFSVTIQLRISLNIDMRREVFGVSCPIADLIVRVQTTARAPFVSLFQVFTMEEGEWLEHKQRGSLMEEGQASLQRRAKHKDILGQLQGQWLRGLIRIGTLPLMVEKLTSTCSKRSKIKRNIVFKFLSK